MLVISCTELLFLEVFPRFRAAGSLSLFPFLPCVQQLGHCAFKHCCAMAVNNHVRVEVAWFGFEISRLRSICLACYHRLEPEPTAP